ncbi:MAG: aldehyde dehydrogenase family protein [Chitinophagaceae bacterium]|nr:aldehyde dehydrogenase family protein [Chitinophagaceae bacterium]
MREESFGPIIGIMKVKSDEDAIEKMNDSEYGLTASVYSSSEQRALKILSQMESGTGYWNCCDRVSAAPPPGVAANIRASVPHYRTTEYAHFVRSNPCT